MLDPGSSAGISNQLVAQLLLVLQPSLTHSGFSGYNLDDVRSVLRSLGIILGACGWGPEVQEGEEAQGNWGTHGDASGSSNDDSGDSIRSCGDDVRVSCRWEGRQDVVAAVAAWLCGEEGAAAVDWCESFPQLVSFLWGYAALAGGGGGAAAVVHVPEPTAGGAAAGQGASTEGASAGAGTGGDGDGAAARWAVGGHEVGAAFEKLVQRTASALILPYRRQASAAELADAVWALSVVGRRWVEGTGCGTGKLLVDPVPVFLCTVCKPLCATPYSHVRRHGTVEAVAVQLIQPYKLCPHVTHLV